MFGDTWTCDICKTERPDARISVHRIPILKKDGVEIGHRNIRYCNDNDECYEKAKEQQS